MVAYINIQMTEYLATNYSLFDLAISYDSYCSF